MYNMEALALMVLPQSSGNHQVMHKKNSVTLTNRPRSTISNPKQGLTDLHKFVRYGSPSCNGSLIIIRKPCGDGITELRNDGNCQYVYAPPLGGGHNKQCWLCWQDSALVLI